jgi:hypothetical protein
MSEIEEPITLRPDPTPILTLSPDDPEEELNEEEQELKRKKEKALRCKVIALHQLGHHPINTNVSNFHHKAKLQLLDMVKELFEKPDEDIVKEFNELCIEAVFKDSPENDYTTFPAYKTPSIRPKQPIMDIAGNIL